MVGFAELKSQHLHVIASRCLQCAKHKHRGATPEALLYLPPKEGGERRMLAPAASCTVVVERT
jgi:hypothetical protein